MKTATITIICGTIRPFKLLLEERLDSFDVTPLKIIFDYDATDDPTHGNQDKKYFDGFYNGYC